LVKLDDRSQIEEAEQIIKNEIFAVASKKFMMNEEEKRKEREEKLERFGRPKGHKLKRTT
jgi:hypothetical protein